MLLYMISYRFYKKPIAYQYFSWYLLISFLISFSAWLLALYKINNLYLSHVYFISQFLLLSLFYHSLFNKKQKRYVVAVILLIFIVLSFQYMINPQLFFHFNIFEIFITSLPIVVYAIIHLYNSLNKTSNYLIINAGILIYITSSTLIFILGNFLAIADMNSAVRNIYLINKVLYVVYLTLILIQWKISFRPVKSK